MRLWCLPLLLTNDSHINPQQYYYNVITSDISATAFLRAIHIRAIIIITIIYYLNIISMLAFITRPHVVWQPTFCSIEEVQQLILLYCLEELYVSSCCLVKKKKKKDGASCSSWHVTHFWLEGPNTSPLSLSTSALVTSSWMRHSTFIQMNAECSLYNIQCTLYSSILHIKD